MKTKNYNLKRFFKIFSRNRQYLLYMLLSKRRNIEGISIKFKLNWQVR